VVCTNRILVTLSLGLRFYLIFLLACVLCFLGSFIALTYCARILYLTIYVRSSFTAAPFLYISLSPVPFLSVIVVIVAETILVDRIFDLLRRSPFWRTRCEHIMSCGLAYLGRTPSLHMRTSSRAD